MKKQARANYGQQKNNGNQYIYRPTIQKKNTAKEGGRNQNIKMSFRYSFY